MLTRSRPRCEASSSAKAARTAKGTCRPLEHMAVQMVGMRPDSQCVICAGLGTRCFVLERLCAHARAQARLCCSAWTALQRQDSSDDRWYCDKTSTFVWRRPLSPPPSRPAQGYDGEPSSARSSPSETAECAAGAASAGAAPATDSAVQSRASRDGAGSQLVGHDSSSILSEASSAVKLPATASSDGLPTAISSGLFPDSDLGQHSAARQGAQSGGEPGYREGGNAQQAPWPPDTASPGKASSPPQA